MFESDLGQDGGGSRAGDAPAQGEDEDGVQHDVERVGGEGCLERGACVAQASEHPLWVLTD